MDKFTEVNIQDFLQVFQGSGIRRHPDTLLIKDGLLLPSNEITREFEKIRELFTRKIAELWKTRNSENKIYVFQQSEIWDGARVVLRFWPNFRLAVLIKEMLIKKHVLLLRMDS